MFSCWYPMFYPKGVKVQVSHVQSVKPSRILATTWDSIQGPQGPHSRVVTTALLLHTVKQLWSNDRKGIFTQRNYSKDVYCLLDLNCFVCKKILFVTLAVIMTRPDEMTLVPWKIGICMLWHVTCLETCSLPATTHHNISAELPRRH